jgi:hypothetical protein
MKSIACLSLLLTAALAPVKAATVIQSFPFLITTPGTYVLNKDMSVPSGPNVAIQISAAVQGPVYLDFQGHTLTGTGTNSSVPISLGLSSGPGEPQTLFR